MKHLVLASLMIAGASLAFPPGAAAEKRVLSIGVPNADAGKLDPHLTTAGGDKGMLNWVFNALVRIRPGEASPEFIEPDLAESWTSSADGKEWVFKIRAGAQCHAGFGEFTAEDAAYSLNRASKKETSSFAADFAVLDKIEVLDKSTLKVTLNAAIPSFLGLVANYHGGMMVCKKAAEQMGADFAKQPIGTGPFMFVEYQPQQFVKLTANKQYFRGAPGLDEIIYRYIPSDATRDLAFQSGEIDMVMGRQNDQWVRRTREIPDARIAAMEPAELNMLHLNMTIKPLDDIRVRRAIAHAIDRKGMVQFSGKEVSREAVSVVPIGNVGTSDAAGLADYSVEKTKRLLAEAGYPDGVTLKSVSSTLPALSRLMEVVQAQLRQASIKLEVEPVDHPTYHANIRKNLSPVTLYQAVRFPIADIYLTQFFHSRSIVGTPAAVTTLSHCAVAVAEIDAARAERDPARQLALWKAAQAKIVEEVCAVPFSESLIIWAWRSSLDLGFEIKGSLNLAPHITEKARFKQ